MEKTFDVNYYIHTKNKREWSHKSTEIWDLDEDIYCPNCGKKGIWKHTEGEYYVGVQHICIECGFSFYLPDGSLIEEEAYDADLQRLKNLKE